MTGVKTPTRELTEPVRFERKQRASIGRKAHARALNFDERADDFRFNAQTLRGGLDLRFGEPRRILRVQIAKRKSLGGA